MGLLQRVGLVIRGAAVRSPMILRPMGQKLVCAAGVERSTLHRCGRARDGLIHETPVKALSFPYSIQ